MKERKVEQVQVVRDVQVAIAGLSKSTRVEIGKQEVREDK